MVSLCLVSYKMNVRLDWLVILEMGVLYMKQLAGTLVSLLSAISQGTFCMVKICQNWPQN